MHDASPSSESPTLGIDAGASLVKLAIASSAGELQLERFPAADLAHVAERVAALGATRVGLTGGGAATLHRLLGDHTTVHDEFASWAAGARRALRERGASTTEPFLLISLGTGTSIQRVEASAAARIGGTALGGGTLLGLGRALTGVADFEALCALAGEGSRARVDLLLSDVYAGGGGPLDADVTASNFGKLDHRSPALPSAADLAAGLVNLIAENVGLIAAGLAHTTQSRRVLIGGSTVRGNPALEERLTALLSAFGCEPHVLANGEYTGAIGTIELQDAVR